MANTPTPTRMQRAGHALRTIPGRIFDALSPGSGNDESHEDVLHEEEEEEHGDAGMHDAEAEQPAARTGARARTPSAKQQAADEERKAASARKAAAAAARAAAIDRSIEAAEALAREDALEQEEEEQEAAEAGAESPRANALLTEALAIRDAHLDQAGLSDMSQHLDRIMVTSLEEIVDVCPTKEELWAVVSEELGTKSAFLKRKVERVYALAVEITKTSAKTLDKTFDETSHGEFGEKAKGIAPAADDSEPEVTLADLLEGKTSANGDLSSDDGSSGADVFASEEERKAERKRAKKTRQKEEKQLRKNRASGMSVLDLMERAEEQSKSKGAAKSTAKPATKTAKTTGDRGAGDCLPARPP